MDVNEPEPSHGHNLRKRPPKPIERVSIPDPIKTRKLTKQRIRQEKTVLQVQKILNEMKTSKTKAPSIKEIVENLAKPDEKEDPYENLWEKDENEWVLPKKEKK